MQHSLYRQRMTSCFLIFFPWGALNVDYFIHHFNADSNNTIFRLSFLPTGPNKNGNREAEDEIICSKGTVDGLILRYAFCLIVLCLDISNSWGCALGMCVNEKFWLTDFSAVSLLISFTWPQFWWEGQESHFLTKWRTQENEPLLRMALFRIPLDWVFFNTQLSSL